MAVVMNTGVMGGTFDPVHNGHLAVAEEARKRLELAEVVFIPAGQPQLKGSRVITPARHRLAMLRLAMDGKPYFRISAMEMERAGPTYTVDTIVALKEDLGEDDKIFFIMGWDSLARLPEWKDSTRLVKLCYLVAAPRPGYPRPDLKALEKPMPGISKRVIFLDRPEIDISGTEIRERVARGLPIKDVVPEPVYKYIKRHKLYSEGGKDELFSGR